MKNKILFFALLSWFSLLNEQAESNEQPNILLTSIPKCGTWMLDKLVGLLTGKSNSLWRLNKEGTLILNAVSNNAPAPNAAQLFKPSLEIFNYCTNLNSNEYLIAHLIYDKSFEQMLINKHFKMIFIVRDPRDQLISRIFYMISPELIDTFAGLKHLSFNELLSSFIGVGANPNQKFEDLLSSHISYLERPKHQAISHISKFYDAFLPWMNSPICYTTYFEKLVGPKGGGNIKDQLEEIKKIAEFIGIKINHNQTKDIADRLFGDSHTFREGKIGSWKKYFSEEHKKDFKRIAGQLLIDLKYEIDFNW